MKEASALEVADAVVELASQRDEAEEDALRLAQIVRSYVAMVEDVAKRIADPNPPKLEAERAALAQHDALVTKRHLWQSQHHKT